MTSHRIEITFVGDAPDSELERAKILGSDKVAGVIGELQEVLTNLGMNVEVIAHTVRKVPRHPRGLQMRVAGGQAAE